jgi:DNA-binding HxlR family transcriptional regulator
MSEHHFIRTCSIWRALEVVGDTPTLLILEATWLGVRRFDQLRDRTSLLKALLSDRLKRLVGAGMLEKRLYRTSPSRHEYHLTQKGRDLYWTSLMLLRWEQRWGTGNDKIRVVLRHRLCGKTFEPTPACGACNEAIDATVVDWKPGPGVGLMAPVYSRRRQQRASSEGATSLFDEAARIMGDRWASLIMRSIFTGINRFDDIRRDTAIATNILAERLGWLVSIGAIRQVQYEASPARYEYKLRRKGVDYYPALLMLMRWGDQYYCSPEGPPLLLEHKRCGAKLEPQVICSECHATLRAEDVEFELIEAETLPRPLSKIA